MRRILISLLPALLILSIFICAPARAQGVDLGLITVKQKKLAEEIHQKLLKGEAFEPLAKAHSVGPAASRGGRLGRVPYKRLRSEYKQALQNLPPGKPSPVIPTEEGYTILMSFDSTAPASPAQASSPEEKPIAKSPRKPGPRPVITESPHLTARTLVMSSLESMMVGDFANAKAKLSQALKHNPQDDSAPFFQKILVGVDKGEYKPEAVKKFAEGFVAMLKSDISKANKLFGIAYKADSRLWQARLFEANIRLGLGQMEEARDLLNQVLKQNPKSPRAHISLGNAALLRNDFKQAKEQFTEAVRLNPKSAEAQYNLATLALNTRDMKEAERRLRLAITNDPFKDEAYNDLGLVLAHNRKVKEAEKSYLKALELNPRLAAAHLNLGNLYLWQDKTNKAIMEYNKALAVDPRLAQAHHNLAAAYIVKEDWAMAIAHADQALRLKFPVSKAILKKLAPHRVKKKQ